MNQVLYYRTSGPHSTDGMAYETGAPILLTVPEACARLRISRWTFYRLLQQRQLRTIRIGSRRLVPVSAVHELITALGIKEND